MTGVDVLKTGFHVGLEYLPHHLHPSKDPLADVSELRCQSDSLGVMTFGVALGFRIFYGGVWGLAEPRGSGSDR